MFQNKLILFNNLLIKIIYQIFVTFTSKILLKKYLILLNTNFNFLTYYLDL